MRIRRLKERAIACFEQSLRLAPDHLDAYRSLLATQRESGPARGGRGRCTPAPGALSRRFRGALVPRGSSLRPRRARAGTGICAPCSEAQAARRRDRPPGIRGAHSPRPDPGSPGALGRGTRRARGRRTRLARGKQVAALPGAAGDLRAQGRPGRTRRGLDPRDPGRPRRGDSALARTADRGDPVQAAQGGPGTIRCTVDQCPVPEGSQRNSGGPGRR